MDDLTSSNSTATDENLELDSQTKNNIIDERLNDIAPHIIPSYFSNENYFINPHSMLWELNPLYSCSLAGSSSGNTRGFVFRMLCDNALDCLTLLYKPYAFPGLPTLKCDNDISKEDNSSKMENNSNVDKNYREFDVFQDKNKCSCLINNNQKFHCNINEDHIIMLKSFGDQQVCHNLNAHNVLDSHHSCSLIDFSKKMESLVEVEKSVTLLVSQVEEDDTKKLNCKFNEGLAEFCKEIDEFFLDSVKDISSTDVKVICSTLCSLQKNDEKFEPDDELNINEPSCKQNSEKLNEFADNLILPIPPQRKKKSFYRKKNTPLVINDNVDTKDVQSKCDDSTNSATNSHFLKSDFCDINLRDNNLNIAETEASCISVEDLTINHSSKPLSSVLISINPGGLSPAESNYSSLNGSYYSYPDSVPSDCTLETYNSHCYSRYCSRCDLDNSDVPVDKSSLYDCNSLSSFSQKSSSPVVPASPLVHDVNFGNSSSFKNGIENDGLSSSTKSNSFIFNEYLLDEDEGTLNINTVDKVYSCDVSADVLTKRLSASSVSSDIVEWKKNIFFGVLDESEEELCVICHKEDKVLFIIHTTLFCLYIGWLLF